MFKQLTFVNLLGVVLVIALLAGIATYIVSGATTNKGTTEAIANENAKIVSAEKTSCTKNGTYGTIATLEREGLLTFKPTYNSVVYVPGKGCGTIVVGSAAYQPAAG